MKRPEKLVILGYGAAGAAIVHELCHLYDITVVCGSFEESSTATNQKWKHSGLLYPSKRLALAMWHEYRGGNTVAEFPFTCKPKARFIALERDTLEEKIATWRRWDIAAHGLDVQPLAKHEYRFAGELMETAAVGGLATPDCVVDFPEVVRNLRREAEQYDVKFVTGEYAAELSGVGDRITRVRLVGRESHESIPCDYCITSLGAWTPEFLAKQNPPITLPLVVRKCHVLVYPGELVPCLTVCLDIRGGIGRDAALVPFKGTTIAAQSMGDTVKSPTDRCIDPRNVNDLMDEYARCFPKLDEYRSQCKSYVCFKTEWDRGGDVPHLGSKVFTSDDHKQWKNLIVAIPGKASLMFKIGRQVADVIRGHPSKD